MVFFPNFVGVLLAGHDGDIAAAPAKKTGGNKDAPAASTAVVAVFDVAGMTCDGCFSHLRSELEKLPDVTNVEVWFTKRKARVTFVSQAKVDKEAVLGVVKEAGFKARFLGLEKPAKKAS